MDIEPNATSNDTRLPFHVEEYKIVLYSILFVWSLVGNLLVVVVIFYNDNLRTCFNYLVLNMTISDLLNPILTIPLRIYGTVGGQWTEGAQGDVLCKLAYFLSDISPTVSIFTLVAVAFERFSAIVFAKRVHITKKKTCFLIILAWFCAMMIYSPYLYVFKVYNSDCSVILSVRPEDMTIFYSILMVGVFTVPFFSIMVIYITILIKLRQAAANISKMLDSRQARTRHRRNQSVVWLSLIIIGAFAVFWGPFFVLLFVYSVVWKFQPPSNINFGKTMFFMDILGLTNACINPCIYFSFQRNYRVGLKRICQRLFFKRLSGHTTIDNSMVSQQTFYDKVPNRRHNSTTEM